MKVLITLLWALQRVSQSADEPSVGKNLLEEHFAEFIDKFLEMQDLVIQCSAAYSIQAVCKLEKEEK